MISQRVIANESSHNDGGRAYAPNDIENKPTRIDSASVSIWFLLRDFIGKHVAFSVISLPFHGYFLVPHLHTYTTQIDEI